MTINEHVNCDTESKSYCDTFYPDEGYALWEDTQTGNIDEIGNPIHYFLEMSNGKILTESRAPHIWARLIDEGMQVYGVTQTTETE